MCVIGRDKLLELIKRYHVIEPYNPDLMNGDSYILTVREDVTLQYLEHRNLISHEIVFTPPNYIAYLTAKSKFGRMGLSFLNAAKVHSGFVGRLALELVNLSNERTSITIRRGDPLMHIDFMTREGSPSPYTGPYQFQYMSDEEVEDYIPVLLKFKGVFNEAQLREAAKRRVRWSRLTP
jgi:dCTP deaminase